LLPYWTALLGSVYTLNLPEANRFVTRL
jgi:hypothetical protein